MMKFLVTVLLFVVFLASNKDVLAQIETRQEYERIQIIRPSPTPLKFQTNQIIQQYIKYYQSRGRSSMEIGLVRSGRHGKMIRRIFTEEGVPEELFWINQTEKMWGISERTLWLFIPEIAPKYGLRKTKYIDETKSFEKATHATAQYLKFLYHKYDENWELAISAYESGERSVDRAIKKAKVKNYWMAYPYSPRETRNFVPNVLATILIANNPESYGFANVKKDLPITYELVRIAPSTSLEMIAEFSDEDIKTIKRLNPELILTETPPEPYVVRVPVGKGITLAKRMRSLLSK